MILLLLLLFTFGASAQEVSIPGVQAKSYIVLDEDGTVILQHDAQTPRPIASITKLLVAEDVYPTLNPTNTVTIEAEDLANRWTHLHPDTVLSEQQLLELALIPSNNQAIYALARVHDEPKVIADVNFLAMQRGLTTISIEEPSGLSENNHASAEDLARFVYLIKDNPVTFITTEEITSYGGYRSTNPLLGKPGWVFNLSKTGFINASGGCVVSRVEIGGKPRVVVLLGSTNTHTRWIDLVKIRQYVSKDDTFWNKLAAVKGVFKHPHKLKGRRRHA